MQNLRSLLLAGLLTAAGVTVGCAGTGVAEGYRVYDPYRSDYRVWDTNEGVFYNQWAVETHHDPHRDLRRLNRADQGEYWNWRHDHPDHG
jgi:hypothetical protein